MTLLAHAGAASGVASGADSDERRAHGANRAVEIVGECCRPCYFGMRNILCPDSTFVPNLIKIGNGRAEH
ncbi:jg11041, partial [Pararge aegeria aegeria]